MEDGGTLTIARPGKPLPHRIKLTVTAGPDAGASVVARQGAVVGRAKQVDLRLADPSVSSFHVELRATADGVDVHDLESRNGTFFEGARLSRAVVPIGSVLTLGGSTLRVDHDVATDEASAALGSFGPMRGASPAIQAVFAWLARVAPTELALLVEGPAGSGKETVARAVHAASKHASGPFVALDCVGLPREIAEAAFESNESVFSAAKDGTLFLDDVGKLDLDVQSRLLRALEGGPRARVIASSRGELRAAVNAGRFREELYLRIAQARVVLPPLAERPEDVATLALHFLQSLPEDAQAVRRLSREAMDELKRREWRGDVRELRAVVERAAMISKGPTIGTGDLAFERVLSAPREPEIGAYREAKRSVLDDFERKYLEALLARVGDNLSRASIVSGVERHHLRDLLRKHGLRKK